MLNRKQFALSDAEKVKIIARLEELFEKERRIQFAYLFGSFIENIPFHDIDIGVGGRGLSSKNAAGFSVELSKKINHRLNYPIDIRVLNFAPIPFRFHAVSGRLIYLKNEQVHSEFLEDTMRRYLDIQPILYRATKEAFAE